MQLAVAQEELAHGRVAARPEVLAALVQRDALAGAEDKAFVAFPSVQGVTQFCETVRSGHVSWAAAGAHGVVAGLGHCTVDTDVGERRECDR